MHCPDGRGAPARGIGLSGVVILLLGAGIAWLTPFDKAFAVVTFGSAPLRALLILALGAVGAMLAPRIGFSDGSRGLKRPVLTPLLWAAGVGVWCAVVDRIFIRSIEAGYVQMFLHKSLADRLLYFILRAFNENILYRLFLTTLLVFALGRFLRGPDGRPRSAAVWIGIVVAQMINVGINITFVGDPITAVSLAHNSLRYLVPGVIWGVLYARHGFVSNEIASTTCHLFLQPLGHILFA